MVSSCTMEQCYSPWLKCSISWTAMVISGVGYSLARSRTGITAIFLCSIVCHWLDIYNGWTSLNLAPDPQVFNPERESSVADTLSRTRSSGKQISAIAIAASRRSQHAASEAILLSKMACLLVLDTNDTSKVCRPRLITFLNQTPIFWVSCD